ncbi:hypothetical protein AB0K51_03855 [Kitasatospora sp. NPDC049285]|uniref:hypothetical protein n=1 Tax=Kitasatospora sp. NPDC049285 TaxID=3157096 RepID=UPI003431E45F
MTPPADPVRELLDANREVCEQATDPLEIAAALEDSGLPTAGTGRYRHADIFGLAEELYARVPRRPPVEESPPPVRERALAPAALGLAAHLLPLAPVALLGAGAAGGALAVLCGALGGAAAEHWSPRAAGAEPAGRPGRAWAALGHGAGTGLLLALLAGSAPGAALAVALGGGTAGWCAARLRRVGRRQLTAATLGEFRSRLRPALPLAVLAQLTATAALAVLTARGAGATGWAALLVLGTLLLLAAVVRGGGRQGTAATAVLTAAAGAAALTLPAPAHWLGAPPPGGLLAACLGPTALLAAAAWPLTGRPGAYR